MKSYWCVHIINFFSICVECYDAVIMCYPHKCVASQSDYVRVTSVRRVGRRLYPSTRMLSSRTEDVQLSRSRRHIELDRFFNWWKKHYSPLHHDVIIYGLEGVIHTILCRCYVAYALVICHHWNSTVLRPRWPNKSAVSSLFVGRFSLP